MKGDYGDECNRTACKQGEAVFYNHVTQRYYCSWCAGQINASAKQSGMSPLCNLGKKEQDEATTGG